MPSPTSLTGSSPKVSIPLILNRADDAAPALPSIARAHTLPLQPLPMLHAAPHAQLAHPQLLPLPRYGAYPPVVPHYQYPQYGAPFGQPYMVAPPGYSGPMPAVPVVPVMEQHPHADYHYARPAAAAPQPQQKSRRFRRRYYQIYRKYSCLFPGCTKSYGLLNHLNTHIVTKKHGLRKSKADFKHIDKDDGPALPDQRTLPAADAPKLPDRAPLPGPLRARAAAYDTYKMEPALLTDLANLGAPSPGHRALPPLVLPTPLWTPPAFALPAIQQVRDAAHPVRLPLLPLVVGEQLMSETS